MDNKDDWTKDFEGAIQGLGGSPLAVRAAQAFQALAPEVPDALVDKAKAIMPVKERSRLTVSVGGLGQAWAGARGGSGASHVVVEVGTSTLRLSFEETEQGYLVQGRIGSGPWFLDTHEGPVAIEPGTMFEQTVPTGEPMRFWNADEEFEVPPLGTMRPEGA